MRKTIAAALACIAMTLAPSAAFAWGFEGHKLIMRRAIDRLPPELKPFFDRFRDEIVLRVVDPDLWRNVGWDEDPNHFLDFGVAEYGAYPFTLLPRDYDAALQKFGMAALKRNGFLPWREAEMFGNLKRGFEGFTRNAPYATSDVILFSAVTSHYIQDAHQPFHATDNYDGRQTGNDGIHARFERDLIERFQSRLNLTPGPPTSIVSPRDTAFDTLLTSYKLVDPILQADREAVAGKDVYDDVYFERLFTKVRPMLEERLSSAISATAGVIVAAWEQAGKPPPRLTDARSLERVRKAR